VSPPPVPKKKKPGKERSPVNDKDRTDLNEKRDKNFLGRKKQATADHNQAILDEMANREHFKTKSGIKVERNKTIEPVSESGSPNRDSDYSLVNNLRTAKEDAGLAHNSDMLARRL